MTNYSPEELEAMHQYQYDYDTGKTSPDEFQQVNPQMEGLTLLEGLTHKIEKQKIGKEESPAFRSPDFDTIDIYFYDELSEQEKKKLDKVVDKWVNPD